jgi:membrane protease YdiL (CAAX protease family)
MLALAESESSRLSFGPRQGRSPLWRAKKLSQRTCGCGGAAWHRRPLVAAVALAGTGLLGASLSTEPDSTEFYALTLAVAGTWLAGGLASGPIPFRSAHAAGHSINRDVATPILLGATAFGAFFGVALVARRIPVLNEALTSILSYADRGSDPLVLAITLANGIAEEVFFRGALFSNLDTHRAVPVSTAVYMAATSATRNPALVVASGVMGGLFAVQRRISGGIQAPILTHVTWSALMLRYLPSLFRSPDNLSTQ